LSSCLNLCCLLPMLHMLPMLLSCLCCTCCLCFLCTCCLAAYVACVAYVANMLPMLAACVAYVAMLVCVGVPSLLLFHCSVFRMYCAGAANALLAPTAPTALLVRPMSYGLLKSLLCVSASLSAMSAMSCVCVRSHYAHSLFLPSLTANC
jgi:hypothetical protein